MSSLILHCGKRKAGQIKEELKPEILNNLIIIIHSNEEGASWIRVNLWKKGLTSLGIKVKIIYLFDIKKNRKISRYLFFLKQVISLFFLPRKTQIIVYFPLREIVWRFIKNKILTIEFNEFPIQVRSPHLKRKENLVYLKYAKNFITCSDELIKFYSKHLSSDCKILKISTVVDTKLFDKNHNPLFIKRKYIAYTGYMGENKDGIFDLLNAYHIFAKENKFVDLCLIGWANPTEMNLIEEFIKNFNIVDRVIITGKINHLDVPKYLKNAELLVLSRPSNIQAKGGFPSKISEYLSTGVPILTTDVGEISNYIKDGYNGYLSAPSNPKMFANKMINLIENHRVAIKAGELGRKLAKEEFDINIQSKKVKNLIFRE